MAKVINLKEARKKDKKSRIDIIKENRKKKKSILGKKRLNKNFKRKAGKVLLILAGIGFFAMLIGAVAVFSYVQDISKELPSTDQPFGPTPNATVIYDRHSIDKVSDGTALYRVFDEFNADPVDINEIPEQVKWAFLAAEDREFYTHNGFDINGILSCALKNIKDRSSVCGGSTVTQQLLKLRTFKDLPPIERKIKEIIFATKIEQTYEKDEILQMYLTVTPFGSSVVGIETASKFYFGKEPKDLTLAEATILAAIVNEPAYLSPTVPLDGDKERAQAALKDRQAYILDQLEEHKDEINNQIRKNKDDKDLEDVFTDDLIEEARNQEITYKEPIATDKKAGHFVDYVMDRLQTGNYKNGEEPFSLEDLQTGGLRIITSLDYDQQVIAEEMVAVGGSSYDYWNVNNAAIMTVDPSTGQILTMAGSKAYYGESSGCNEEGIECKYDPEVNVLTSLNEPGSTNKPLAYTLAFDEGKLAPGSNLPDVPIDYPEIGYAPKNWDGRNMGADLTARSALVNSRNIPALQVIEMIGIDKYVETAQNLGYTTYQRDQVGPSIVLGGASVKYTEHIQAYAAFANEGNYIPIDPILKITDSKGNVLYEAKPEKKQVLNPQAVYLLNEVLHDLQGVTSHTGITLSCKTGTTESNTEALQICWNNNQITLAWVGNNNNDPLDAANGYPILVVQPWMEQYFSKINAAKFYEGKDPNLKRPGYVYVGSGCPEGSGSCAAGATDWLIQDKPAPSYKEKKKFTVCTDQQDRLARDIDKALGKSQEIEITRYIMPASRWQKNLDDWVKANKGYSNVFPTENCNIDRTSGSTGPVVFAMSSPVNGTNITSNSINVQGSVASVSGNMTNLIFKLNGSNIGSSNTFQNFNQTFNISSLNLGAGNYDFEAIGTDSNNKTGSYKVTVTIPVPISNEISFTNMPPTNLTFGINVGGAFTHNIDIKYTGSGTLNNPKLYQVKSTSGGTTVTNLGAMNSLGGGSFRLAWGNDVANEDATYTFYVIGKVSGNEIQSNNSSAVNVDGTP